MENQCSQDENHDSCECACHPGFGVAGCSGCAQMHGTSKMGSMDPLEMVMRMWYKASFRAYSEFQNGMSFLQSLRETTPLELSQTDIARLY